MKPDTSHPSVLCCADPWCIVGALVPGAAAEQQQSQQPQQQRWWIEVNLAEVDNGFWYSISAGP
jgi:hypothetical protein